jgi:predicted metal-binding membrane protein
MMMEMPGQTWPAAAVTFLGMWTLMTAAMMLPSLLPMLVRYRRDVIGASGMHAGILTVVVALAYFGMWVAIGVLVFPFSVVIGRVHPLAGGGLVTAAIAYQFTRWKVRDLACCRHMLVHAYPRSPDAGVAWHAGVRYGLHCARCCANLMVIPLVPGMMNMGVMLVVGAVIAAERFRNSGRICIIAPPHNGLSACVVERDDRRPPRRRSPFHTVTPREACCFATSDGA